MKLKTFNYGKFSYEYYLVFQNRKTLALTVQPNLKIILKCPFSYCEHKIEKFLKRKWVWLEKQLHYFSKFQKKYYQKEFVSGESFLYLGRQYKLLLKQSKIDHVKFTKGLINLFTTESFSNSKHNKRILEKWYADKTQTVFKERYEEVMKKFDYDFTPELVTRKMNKRWGSFLSNKKIILNSLLLLMLLLLLIIDE